MAEVSMDYGVVEEMANEFRSANETLEGVSKALEVAIAVLKATSFFGLIGNAALATYLEGIKPNVDRLAATCQEMNLDLLGAIVSLRDGDYTGSQRFV